MFSVRKTMEIAGSHSLKLPYKSKCSKTHGHNWIVTVEILADTLNKDTGMVMDFGEIKEIVNQLDHTHLNDILGNELNPTAENIAKWICDKLVQHIDSLPQEQMVEVNKVTVQESAGNLACYIP